VVKRQKLSGFLKKASAKTFVAFGLVEGFRRRFALQNALCYFV
jgi:hypothetical protein